jgi:hypothetical protein
METFLIIYFIVSFIIFSYFIVVCTFCESEIKNQIEIKTLTDFQLHIVCFLACFILSIGWIITIPILLAEIYKNNT